MVILGVSNTTDSGACLLIDGALVAAVNEERLTCEKMTRAFPKKSILWLLREYNLKPRDIHAIGLGTWKGVNCEEIFREYRAIAEERMKEGKRQAELVSERISHSLERDKKQWEELKEGLKELGFANHRIFQCQHQLAHAYCAFEFAHFPQGLAIVLDGRGDFMSGSVSRWKKGRQPQVLRSELELDSLGAFYGWITRYLGFTPHRHEGKITGLAAFGSAANCRQAIRKMIGYSEGRIRANLGSYYTPNMWGSLPELEKELKNCKAQDIACAAQELLEEVVVSYARHYLKITGERNLCLAGGIFANVLVNMRLRELPEVENLFVYPHMGDGGIAVGGAAYAACVLEEKVSPLKDVYLGPGFGLGDCERAITENGYKTIKYPDFSERVAELIHQGLAVGFFNGRMEYGPRALGNRSILIRASEPGVNESLNRRLNRTEFMPFAPVTLEEEAPNCYTGWSKKETSSYFMTSCFRCTELMRRQSPAAIHIDGTARPQVVNENLNKEYYAVLKAYYRLSGVPTIINTSFNYHENPIICQPRQAVEMLKTKAIDALAMPPFILLKEDKIIDKAAEKIFLKEGARA